MGCTSGGVIPYLQSTLAAATESVDCRAVASVKADVFFTSPFRTACSAKGFEGYLKSASGRALFSKSVSGILFDRWGALTRNAAGREDCLGVLGISNVI
jgi:hypothetical protein